MLMTAAVHMDSSISSSTSPPPCWRPVLTVASHHQLLHNFTPAASAPSPSPAALPPPGPPPSSNQHQQHPPLRATPRRVTTKRRPRPSRRLPTTYISADPASFRRMVHQVTGADDLPLPLPQQPADAAEILARPAPIRAHQDGGFTGPGALLPTLDTSASFLVDALISRTRMRTDAPRPGCDDGSAAAAAPALEVEGHGLAGARACNNNNTGGGGGCFPTLESWDHALF